MSNLFLHKAKTGIYKKYLSHCYQVSFLILGMLTTTALIGNNNTTPLANASASVTTCQVSSSGNISAPATAYYGQEITITGTTPSADSDLEYMWFFNPSASYFSSDAIDLGTGDTPDLTYTITQSGWFIRCVRPKNCGWSWFQALETNSEYVEIVASNEEPNTGCYDCSQLNTNINGFMFLGTLNGHAYYKKLYGDVPFTQAQNYATQLGGYLAVINSQEENDFLVSVADGQFWLGLTDAGTEGSFHWINGEPLDYQNWAPGEPNNYNGNQDHVFVYSDGTWDDTNGNSEIWVIVEVPCPLSGGTIGGNVFMDFDGDGLQGAGEGGLGGVEISLFSADGTKSVLVSGNSGTYFFGDLEPGTYTVVVGAAPEGCPITTATTYDITIGCGDHFEGNFGFMPGTMLGSIGCVAFMDADANGVQEGGEAGAAGIIVYLYDQSNNIIAVKTTAADGTYSFGGLAAGTYTVVAGSAPDASSPSTPDTYTITLAAGENVCSANFGFGMTSLLCELDCKVYLQGAAEPAAPKPGKAGEAPELKNAFLMRDNLRSDGLIPLSEPYADMVNFAQVGNGDEITTDAVLNIEGEDAIVDWVLLEIRDNNDATNIIATRSALVQRDGDIVDVDGVSPVSFDIADGDYNLAVRHRNHLGVMTATPISFSTNSIATVDFTDPATATYGSAAQANLGGSNAMWAGDTDCNGTIIFQGNNSDTGNVFFEVMFDENNPGLVNYIVSGYNSGDIDMSCTSIYQGNDNDVTDLFFNILVHPDNLQGYMNFIIEEQLPE